MARLEISVSRSKLSAACALLFIAASCGEPVSPVSHETMHGGVALVRAAADGPWIGDVRDATKQFQSNDLAARAGYALASPCVAHPTLGGMGFHWVNNALVDPVFNPRQPEALVYAPDQNGRRTLAALEYIVIDVGQPAPTFAGQPFDVGGTPVPVPHWSLHVWIYRPNPSGIFSPWNPSVTCS